MIRALACLLIFSSTVGLIGCGSVRVVRAVAVASYNVATAPVKFVARQLDDEEPSQTTTVSDVETPGHPVPVATPKPQRRSVAGTGRTGTAQSKPKTSASAQAGAQPQFPVAKPVPGRTAQVFNPFTASGTPYIDVSGFPPGSKAKDPDTKKIFIVP